MKTYFVDINENGELVHTILVQGTQQDATLWRDQFNNLAAQTRPAFTAVLRSFPAYVNPKPGFMLSIVGGGLPMQVVEKVLQRVRDMADKSTRK